MRGLLPPSNNDSAGGGRDEKGWSAEQSGPWGVPGGNQKGQAKEREIKKISEPRGEIHVALNTICVGYISNPNLYIAGLIKNCIIRKLARIISIVPVPLIGRPADSSVIKISENPSLGLLHRLIIRLTRASSSPPF